VRLAAARTVEALLDERASLGPSLLALLDRPVCGCRFVEATVGGVTLPPELRRLFGRFPTGVTALCALDQGKPVGMTASAFVAISLNPP
uniref:flavin reductase n=1 Tax=Klebsiella pneumoniae TaxID=573 RepID=UPI001954E555